MLFINLYIYVHYNVHHIALSRGTRKKGL